MQQTTVQQPMMQPMMQQTTVQQPMMQPMMQQTTVQQPMMPQMVQQTVQQPMMPMMQPVQPPMMQTVVQQPQMVQTVVQPQMVQTVQPGVTVVQSVQPAQETITKVTKVTFFKNVQKTNSCDFIVMIDKSGSMSTRGRWQQASQAVALVTAACCKASPEGITAYFFGSPGSLQKFTNIKSSDQVVGLFSKCRPAGTTCLDGALANAFESHFAKPKTIPTAILVITDGEPNSKQAVVNEILKAASRCLSGNELSVSFLQVGNDAACARFLRKIDKCRMKARYPIVDTLSHEQVANFEDFVKNAC